ncbi:MAG: radical SAM protein [Patescibacteria group bacterium]|nr:radical SAM protein [Patescibacteria group bacterium]
MQSFVCGKFIDRYLIASRFSNRGVIIGKKAYYQLLELSKADSEIVPWTTKLLSKMGVKTESKQKLNDIILVRKPTEFNFGKASYEITESCNYKCSHCYLGCKAKSNLSFSDKKKIIELIERSGCLWLQITGGEPLLDKDFVEIYSFAHSLGLLVTLSTNGSLLVNSQIADVLKTHPPYRLTMNAYGATANSYESLTRTSGSFRKFMDGVNWASKTGIRTRLNIIATRYNQDEISDMIIMAKNFGFEYHVFSTIFPTIDGNIASTKLMAQKCEIVERHDRVVLKKDSYVPCKAGKTFFHVNSVGEMSICKTARNPSVNLFQNGIAGLCKLSQISSKLLDLPLLCNSCELRESCTTCPPILNLYLRSGTVPSFVCSKYQFKRR